MSFASSSRGGAKVGTCLPAVSQQHRSVANTFVRRRWKDLRTLINAVVASIVPVFQGGVLLVMTMSVFVTVGVELFAEQAPEQFGSFFKGFYTLFGVIAYGRWPDNVDGLNPFDEEGNVRVEIVTFIYLYVVVVVIVLLQVVVAGPVHLRPMPCVARIQYLLSACAPDKDRAATQPAPAQPAPHVILLSHVILKALPASPARQFFPQFSASQRGRSIVPYVGSGSRSRPRLKVPGQEFRICE